VKRLLVYKPAAQRELAHMDRSDATRIIHALEASAADGRGDVKALKGALKGRYRLRIGKWRVFFSLDQPGNVVVSDLDRAAVGNHRRFTQIQFSDHTGEALAPSRRTR
jgi:mRNA-degrading endonuclease RelE of RelBE toxin-antitoxin system